MKLGAAVWCFTHPHYEPPYEEAIRTIGSLGVDGIEMIAYTAEDLNGYYTQEKCAQLRALIEEYGMAVSEFVLYAHAVVGLLDPDDAVREEALNFFRRGIEVAKMLGTDTINIVSNWPEEIKAPIPYTPSYIHPCVNGYQKFNPKQVMEMPEDFDADGNWDRYMDSLKKIMDMCEKEEMRFALEGHANVLVGTTDAVLRAFDWVPSDRFGTNFDTAWQLMQREYLPWSICKLGKKIFHVHIRDADGLISYTLPVGQGIIDWHGVVKALKKVGFDGYLSLELAGLENQYEYAKQSIDYIRGVLEAEGVLEK